MSFTVANFSFAKLSQSFEIFIEITAPMLQLEIRSLGCCRFGSHQLTLIRPAFRTPSDCEPQRRVPPPGIVEPLDVIEHVSLGLGACTVWLGRCAFDLQRGEEALHRRIVPDVAGPTHTTGGAAIGQEPLERLTGILAPPLGVMQHGRGLPPLA